MGLAIGIVSAGQALEQGGVPFAAVLLVNGLGWRGAPAFMRAVSLAILMPLVSLIGQSPTSVIVATPGAAPPERDLSTFIASNTIVVWLSSAVLFCCTTISVPLVHLVPLTPGPGIRPG